MPFCFILAVWFFAATTQTPAVLGQKADEHAVERIAVPDVPDASGKRPELAEAAKKIVDQTNAFRKKEGRKLVATATKLTDTAKYFADHMARNDEYGHRADGNNPDERVKRHEYQFCLIAETSRMRSTPAGSTSGLSQINSPPAGRSLRRTGRTCSTRT